jgi:Domain of unknown function (DUF1707)
VPRALSPREEGNIMTLRDEHRKELAATRRRQDDARLHSRLVDNYIPAVGDQFPRWVGARRQDWYMDMKNAFRHGVEAAIASHPGVVTKPPEVPFTVAGGIRALDSDREEALAILREAHALGAIDAAELEVRQAYVIAAVRRDELNPVILDLPEKVSDNVWAAEKARQSPVAKPPARRRHMPAPLMYALSFGAFFIGAVLTEDSHNSWWVLGGWVTTVLLCIIIVVIDWNQAWKQG